MNGVNGWAITKVLADVCYKLTGFGLITYITNEELEEIAAYVKVNHPGTLMAVGGKTI